MEINTKGTKGIVMDCEDCIYYDEYDDRCTYITCDGLDCDEPLPCEER